MTIKVCKLNELNKNNHIYTEESFITIPEKVIVTDGIVPYEEWNDIPSSKIIGEAKNLRFENSYLMADIDLETLLTFEKEFVSCGYGETDETGLISKYEMRSVNMINKEASAWN